MGKPCCPHPVERHAYNGCANCGCSVRWTEHPDRDFDTSPAGLEQNKLYREQLAARVAELERERDAALSAAGAEAIARDGDRGDLALVRMESKQLRERITFIAQMALTAAQTAVPHEARIQMLHEISAACRGEFPDWWKAFKLEHRIGDAG